jgi:hypothetical protein
VNSARQEKLLAFMRQEPYAVEASVTAHGRPQAALVGIVVTDRFEVFFDTLADSRKAVNLRGNPAVALVIGPAAAGSERTVQLEGAADEPKGPELARLLELYLARFPDGLKRQQWPGISYWRIRPTWLRYSDFSIDPPEIVEWTESDFA